MPHIHELYDFTVSAYILHPTEHKLCLHFHKKFAIWLQPGGHVELNEDPLQALEHELLEEVGFGRHDYEFIELYDQPHPRQSKTLPIPFHTEVHNVANTPHKHIDSSYLIRAKTNKFNPQEGESSQIEWFTIEDIRDMHKNKKMYDGTLDICEWVFESIHKL